MTKKCVKRTRFIDNIPQMTAVGGACATLHIRLDAHRAGAGPLSTEMSPLKSLTLARHVYVSATCKPYVNVRGGGFIAAGALPLRVYYCPSSFMSSCYYFLLLVKALEDV